MKESIEKGGGWKKLAVALRVKVIQIEIYNMVASLIQQSQTDELIALLNAVQELSSETYPLLHHSAKCFIVGEFNNITPLYGEKSNWIFQV